MAHTGPEFQKLLPHMNYGNNFHSVVAAIKPKKGKVHQVPTSF